VARTGSIPACFGKGSVVGGRDTKLYETARRNVRASKRKGWRGRTGRSFRAGGPGRVPVLGMTGCPNPARSARRQARTQPQQTARPTVVKAVGELFGARCPRSGRRHRRKHEDAAAADDDARDERLEVHRGHEERIALVVKSELRCWSFKAPCRGILLLTQVSLSGGRLVVRTPRRSITRMRIPAPQAGVCQLFPLSLQRGVVPSLAGRSPLRMGVRSSSFYVVIV
jgi:hypothetical protein